MTAAFPMASPSAIPAASGHGLETVSSNGLPVSSSRQRCSSGKGLSHPPILHPHQTHSPTQSASGDLVQGLPEDAGGVHTSTSRGKVVLAGNPLSASTSSPASLSPAASMDLLAPSSVVATPGCSPAASAMGGASPVRTPGSALSSRASSPTRPAASPIAKSPALGSASTLGTRSRRQSSSTKVLGHQHPQSVTSGTASPVPSGTATLFERDVEFAHDHPLTGSEAIDLAAAPILSEIATLAVTNDAPVLSHSASIILNPSSMPAGSLAPSPSPTPDLTSISTAMTTPIKSSGHTPSHIHGALSNASGSQDFSSPPSLSLSPSVVGSPISSTPGSPILSTHPHGLGSSMSADYPQAKEIDIAGGTEPNRRLSFISYADIINSERLTDNSSPFPPSATSSPGPSTLFPSAQAQVPSTAQSHSSELFATREYFSNGETESEDKTTPTGTVAHNTPRKGSRDIATEPAPAPAASWDIFGLGKALGSAVSTVEGITTSGGESRRHDNTA